MKESNRQKHLFSRQKREHGELNKFERRKPEIRLETNCYHEASQTYVGNAGGRDLELKDFAAAEIVEERGKKRTSMSSMKKKMVRSSEGPGSLYVSLYHASLYQILKRMAEKPHVEVT
jgi:hypothetical protein